jgi:hypothetical protein
MTQELLDQPLTITPEVTIVLKDDIIRFICSHIAKLLIKEFECSSNGVTLLSDL